MIAPVSSHFVPNIISPDLQDNISVLTPVKKKMSELHDNLTFLSSVRDKDTKSCVFTV
jgi:hypothetical protein